MNHWPISLELPVQWGEMDAFQHVNNVAYLRWFESARIAYFEAAGVLEGMPYRSGQKVTLGDPLRARIEELEEGFFKGSRTAAP